MYLVPSGKLKTPTQFVHVLLLYVPLHWVIPKPTPALPISTAIVRQMVAVRFFIRKVWHGLSGTDKVEWVEVYSTPFVFLTDTYRR